MATAALELLCTHVHLSNNFIQSTSTPHSNKSDDRNRHRSCCIHLGVCAQHPTSVWPGGTCGCQGSITWSKKSPGHVIVLLARSKTTLAAVCWIRNSWQAYTFLYKEKPTICLVRNAVYVMLAKNLTLWHILTCWRHVVCHDPLGRQLLASCWHVPDMFLTW